MVDIASEKAPERLRQIAQIALADNDRLVRRIVKLTRELAELRGKSQQDLALEMQHLKEELAELKEKSSGGPPSAGRLKTRGARKPKGRQSVATAHVFNPTWSRTRKSTACLRTSESGHTARRASMYSLDRRR
jgi:ribosomal protein L29